MITRLILPALFVANLISAHGSQIDYLLQEVRECKKGTIFSGQNYLSAFDNFNRPEEVLVIEFTSHEESGVWHSIGDL